MGIKPIFTTSYVQDILKDYVEKAINKEVEILKRIGEIFVNDAKLKGEYKDRTSNLRSSIGYVVLNDGKIIGQKYESKSKEARAMLLEMQSEYSQGLVLVGFAGMEYAAALESKNYDVISGSAPTAQTLKEAFNKFI